MITTRIIITRDMLQREPETLFVFGDNMEGRGYGGQAAAMRGEPNALGIPTKWRPANIPSAYFRDSDLPKVEQTIRDRFMRLEVHLACGKNVVWPEMGVRSGLASLQARAPAIYRLIEELKDNLFAEFGPG